MDEILVDFKEESKGLVEELTEILEDIEGDFDSRADLEKYGQVVDRIMGGAQSLEMAVDVSGTMLPQISKYSQLCKLVGYKASQVDNEEFFNVVVALLLDATEMLDKMVHGLGDEEKGVEEFLSDTFLDRLKWISTQFDENLRASVAVSSAEGSGQEESKDSSKGQSQSEIDVLLKSLGV